MTEQKHIFWQALIVALIMFNFGIFMGYMLEKSRIEKIDVLYAESELQLFDARVQTDIAFLKDIDCNILIKENLKFADRIYEEAKILQKYEDASRISDALILRHKKYDLLRTQAWLNSINLKEKCNASHKIVVYLYEYSRELGIELKAKQNIFSRKLADIKEKFGDAVLLLPIAGNINISSINILRSRYNLTELPTILIEEKVKISTLDELKEIENYLI